MKHLLLLVLISTYTSLLGQDMHLREKIIKKANEIDSSEKQSAVFFTTLNSQFLYKKSNGKLVKFIHRFKESNAKTEQVFYINNGELIYSTETEVLYFSKDSSSWRGKYFFVNGKSELDNWEPGKEVVRNYKRTRNMIVAHTKQKGEPR